MWFQQKYIDSYNDDKKLYDKEKARYRFLALLMLQW